MEDVGSYGRIKTNLSLSMAVVVIRLQQELLLKKRVHSFQNETS